MAIAQDLSGNSPIGFDRDPAKGSRNAQPALKSITNHNLTAGASAVSAGPFSPATKYVRIYSAVAIYYKVGQAVTATSSDQQLPAGAVETFEVTYPDVVSVLQVSSGGAVTITEQR